MLIEDLPAYQNVLLQRDGVAYVAPSTLQDWMNRAQAQSALTGLRQLALDAFAFQKQYSKSFHDAGVLLMLGTDSPVIPGLVPGFSLHEEMRILSEAGISNYDILVMGTRQPGLFMQQHLTGSVPFGTIGVGHRADLILLENSPLQDLSNLKDRAGVMARGTWYSEAELRSMLDALAQSYMN